jgi:hypothetical protein
VIDRNKKKKAGNFVWSQPRTHLGRWKAGISLGFSPYRVVDVFPCYICVFQSRQRPWGGLRVQGDASLQRPNKVAA